MYSKLQFNDTILYKNTEYSILKSNKRIQKKTLEQLNSFFDKNDTINHFKYKKNELENIIIPNIKKYYDRKLFSKCINLKNILLSNNSKELSEYMFDSCVKLENIILPNGLLSIKKGAFYCCEHLKYIEIPDSVSTIDIYAFAHCPELKYIKFRGKKYTSPERFNKDMEKNGLIKYTDDIQYIWSKNPLLT